MDNITIERGPSVNIMKLNDDEQALLNEFEVSARPAAPARRPPPVRRERERERDVSDMDAFMNSQKARAPQQSMMEENDTFDMGEEEEELQEPQERYPSGPSAEGEQPSPGYTSIDDEKADLLNKLARLAKKPDIHVNKSLNAYSDISEVRTEYKRIIYGIEADQWIKNSRRMLIAGAHGIEILNKKWNPVDLMLDGWTESLMANIDDYDGVFEELYAKYRTKISVAPEVKLVMMLGSSAMMFHFTKTMFNAAMPNVGEVMKQNPDLLKNMMTAVQNTQRQREEPAQTQAPVDGRREMRGPAVDISALLGGMGPSFPARNTSHPPPIPEDEDDTLSDIISMSGGDELREVRIPQAKSRKRGKKAPAGTIDINV